MGAQLRIFLPYLFSFFFFLGTCSRDCLLLFYCFLLSFFHCVALFCALPIGLHGEEKKNRAAKGKDAGRGRGGGGGFSGARDGESDRVT